MPSQHVTACQFMDADPCNFERVIEGTGSGTWEWKVQSGEVLFNKRWAEILGYTLADLQPISIDTWYRLTHPDDLVRANTALQAHFDGKTEFYECEIRMQHKSGHWVWILDRGKVIKRMPDGTPLVMAGAHIDISTKKALQEMREKLLEQLEALAHHVPGVLYEFVIRPDGSFYYAYVSDNVFDVYGFAPHELLANPLTIYSKIHPDDLPEIRKATKGSFRKLSFYHQKYRIIHPTKGERWIESQATPKTSSNGDVVWYGYSHDITLEHDTEEQLKVAANVFAHSEEAILITDCNMAIVDCNAAFTRITGYTLEETKGLQPDFLGAHLEGENDFTKFWTEINKQGYWHGEFMSRHKSGEAYATLLSISAVKNDHGLITHYVGIFSDISGIKKEHDELMHYANYDELTKLPNRRLLLDRLSQAIKQVERTNGQIAVCMLDLDGFKEVNDTHGHEAGDRLLQSIAQRLLRLLRADDTVARLGGDEFVLLLREVHSTEVFYRILSAVHSPVEIGDGIKVTISTSIGLSYLHSRKATCDQLLREADNALYEAKKAGRNQYVVFQREPQ